MKQIVNSAVGIVLWAAVGSTASAHHSFAMFDGTTSVVLEGTVKTVQLTNPHSLIVIAAPGSDGVVKNWDIEGPSPNNLIRRGWKHSDVNAGDRVTLTMHPRKDGVAGGVLVSVKLPDGRELQSGAGQRPSTLPPK